MKKQIDRQLYTLLDKLRTYVEDESVISGIVGYSVLKSLVDFDTHAFSRQPREIKEIISVYEGLEEVIENYHDLNKDTHGNYSEVHILSNLKKEIYPKIKKILGEINGADSKIREYDSFLFRSLLSKTLCKKGNLEESIQGFGDNVVKKVEHNGYMERARNRVYHDDYVQLSLDK